MEDPREESFNSLYRCFKKVKRRVKNLNIPELRLILFFLLIISFNCISNAQELASTVIRENFISSQTFLDLNFGSKIFGHTALTKPDVDFDSTDVSVFGNVDSLFGDLQPRLLPDNMSFMEKFLWGEGGLTRKIGLVAPLSPEERDYELGIRRTMLTTHQMLGFATLALMLTADYFGQ